MLTEHLRIQRNRVVKLLREAAKASTTARLVEKNVAPSSVAALAIATANELQRISRELKQCAADLGFEAE